MSNDNPQGGNMIAVEQSRAVEETQAALVIAKKFPRDEDKAANRILQACKRKTLAESALYAYPKGDTVVSGPSIRMAEVMAQNWGNMDFGIRELSQTRSHGNEPGESICQAYCWDTEHNVKQEKVFTVPHWRHTRNGGYPLNDPREIYEMVANNGARRLRACILGVIPGWVQDEAVDQVTATLAGGDGNTPITERVQKIVVKLEEFGVTSEMVVAKLGHNLDACSETELVSLKAIGKTLQDGMAKPAAFFPSMAPNESTSKGKAGDLNAALSAEDEPATEQVKDELSPKDKWIIDVKSLAAEMAVEDLLEQLSLPNEFDKGLSPADYIDDLIEKQMAEDK